MPETSFLFRFDSSRDNDEFMTLRGERHGSRYAGILMNIGGWVPDFAELTVDEAAKKVELTLIELEANEIVARASCRKYLPENSSTILDAFSQYMESVVKQCRATADPRLETFQHLQKLISQALVVCVRTAGALRTSPDFLEVFPLLDQPQNWSAQLKTAAISTTPSFIFEGVRRLSREEVDGLRRVARIIHAVVVGKDHCGSDYKGWRNISKKPLDMVLDSQPASFPELRALVSIEQSGATIDSAKIISELTAIWAASRTDVTFDQVRTWIQDFHPIALSFRNIEPMENIFAAARKIVANSEENTEVVVPTAAQT